MNIPRRMLCPQTGKVIHWTQASANRLVDAKRFGAKPEKVCHYQCQHCGFWHLAKKRKK